MTWNHRVVRTEAGGEVFFAIHEAYYTKPDDTIPRSISESGIDPTGETLDELRTELERFKAALDKPVLELVAGCKIQEWVEPAGPEA